MSQVAKEDKSYSVEDLVPSKEINFGSSKVLFAHQASAGDKSIDLTNLVTPSDMGSNGFVQALSTEISAAHLSVLRNNLDLRSTRGPLIPFLDYVVTDAGTINFLPTSVLGVEGALEGEIFVGVIDTKKANSLVVGDVKEYDVTIDDTNFTPGDTILNLGVKYKVNENSLNQTGEFRAYKNGKRIYRNKGNAAASPSADGNYHEVDAGTGEGTTIELNVPAEAGDIFGFDFGLKISKGDVAIFEALERLQGSFLKLATDAAPGLGNPLSDYFTANPSEIERRAFGDLLLSLLPRVSTLEDGLPFAEIVYDGAGFAIPTNAETAFTWTSITRQRGGVVSVSGANVNITKLGKWKVGFQCRFQNDVWTKYYMVRVSDNAIVGESIVQGNARDGNYVEMFFDVTELGDYQFRTYMTGGESVTAAAFGGAPRGVITRLAMLTLEML